MLKKAARIQKGSAETSKVSAGTIRRSQLRDIAEVKMKDLNANDLDAATRIIEGSARAMGLERAWRAEAMAKLSKRQKALASVDRERFYGV